MRFTEKGLNIHKTSRYATSPEVYDLYDKLSKLEDIEEELGVDLVTLFKALKNGICSKAGDYVYCSWDDEPRLIGPKDLRLGIVRYIEYKNKTDKPSIDEETLCLFEQPYEIPHHPVRLKDYGKTWALTKEELE